MEHTKLAIGDDVTFQVREVLAVKTGNWPEYEWHADDGRVILTPQAAMDRQFAKLKLSPSTISGYIVKVERAPNQEDAKKSWWNLHIMGQSDMTAPTPSKRLTSPAKDTEPVITPQSLKDDPQGHGEAWEESGEDPLGLIDAAEQAREEQKEAVGKVVTLYLRLWDRVAAHQVEYAKAHDFSVDGTSIQAAAATIFIELNKRNLLR